jgi:hypothetical protein
LFPPPVPGPEPGPDVADLDGRRDDRSTAELWGRWAGRQEELYIACAERVARLRPPEILRMAGPETQLQLRIAKKLLRDLAAPPPRELRQGHLNVLRSDPRGCRVVTYNSWDPLDVSAELLRALAHFDGRPTPQVLAAIEEAGEPGLTDALVQKLVDFELLVPSAVRP